MNKSGLVIAILGFVSCGIFSQPCMDVMPKMFSESTRGYAHVYQDTERTMTPDLAREHFKKNGFLTADQFVLPDRYEGGLMDYWVAIVLCNKTTDTVYCIAEGSILEFYPGNHIRGQFAIGYAKDPFGYLGSEYERKATFFISPSCSDTCFFKMKHSSQATGIYPLLSDLSIYEGRTLSKVSGKFLYYGLSMGILFVLVFFSSFLWIQERDRAFYWYAFYCLTLLFMGYRNLEEFYEPLAFSRKWIPWAYTKSFNISMLFITYLAFFRYFIDLKNYYPKLNQFLKLVPVICLTCLAIDLLITSYNEHYAYFFYWYYRLIGTLLCFGLFYYLFKIPTIFSKILIVGGAFLLVGEVVSDFVPPTIDSEVSMTGVLIENLVFTVGLALRQQHLRKQRDQIEKEHIKTLLTSSELELKAQKQLELERNRIASEMHDDIGAGVSTIRFMSIAAKTTPDHTERMLKLEKIADRSSEVLERMSEIIWVMNSKNDQMEHFVAYTRRYALEYLQDLNMKVTFTVQGNLPDLELSGNQRRHILLSMKECLHNIAKHSKATEVGITLNCQPQFTIEIKDNGKGFNLTEQSLAEISRNGRNGLWNIKERMQEIGGEAFFENRNGLRVLLSVALQNK